MLPGMVVGVILLLYITVDRTTLVSIWTLVDFATPTVVLLVDITTLDEAVE